MAKNNNNTENNSVFEDSVLEIDLKRIFSAILGRAWIVCLSTVLCGIIALVGTVYLITPKYQSSAMFYVNNNSLSVGDASFSITSGDITAAKSLVDTYIVILKSRTCLNDVIDYADLDLSYKELKSMISASAVNSTEIFEVVVTSPNPVQAKEIANAIAHILPKKISNIVESTAANVVDYAVKSSTPSSPNYSQNTILGLVIGFILSVLIIAIREIFDITIRTEEDMIKCCEYPLLSSVPDMISKTKGGYYYSGYGNNSKNKNSLSHAQQNKTPVIGKNISFAASEAYKLLRTKIQFSFVDEVKCPVIGVSSAMSGEGKSVSSVNLAYSLSQLNKKILLVDCDMRRPTLGIKLHIQKIPGLSNYLTGQSSMSEVIQTCNITDTETLDVIASGNNPPNPIELLSSSKMEKAIEKLRESYDYIIIDLPPVGEVSDAMVAAKMADGILLVVRQDYCNTWALGNAVNQFEFIESKILGVVMNCVNERSAKYHKRYYKRYYRRYGGYYGAYGSYSQDSSNKEKNKNK